MLLPNGSTDREDIYPSGTDGGSVAASTLISILYNSQRLLRPDLSAFSMHLGEVTS